MSVIQDNSITTNSVKPADGQSLVLKKAGGTASITVATNGEATFAENIILTANKGLSFQNHSVSSATGASSTTSDNVLDDYEEGTFTLTVSSYTGGTGSPEINSQNTNIGDNNYSSNYTKIGNIVCISVSIKLDTNSATPIEFGGLPFTVSSGGGGAQMEDSTDSNILAGIVATHRGTSICRYLLVTSAANSGASRNVSFGFSYRTS